MIVLINIINANFNEAEGEEKLLKREINDHAF